MICPSIETHCTTKPSRLPSSLSLPNVEKPPVSPSPYLNPGASAGRAKVTLTCTFLSIDAEMVKLSAPDALPSCLISYIFSNDPQASRQRTNSLVLQPEPFVLKLDPWTDRHVTFLVLGS